MRKRFGLAMTLVMLCVAALALVWLTHRERLLLARAHRVAIMDKWVGGNRNHADVPPHVCFWLSDRDVLLFRRRKDFLAEAFRLNTQTHQETPLADFNRLVGPRLATLGTYHDGGGPHPDWPTDWELINPHLSPDGTQLLWMAPGTAPDGGRFTARLDGTALCAWPAEKYPIDLESCRALWLPDNRRWLEISMLHASDVQAKGRLVVRWQDTQTPGRSVKQSLPLGNAPDLPQRAWEEPLGITPDNRLIVLPLYSYGPKLTLAVWDLTQPEKPAVPLFLNLPNVGSIERAALSPNGKRLAFFCKLNQPVPGPPLWAAVLRKLGLKERQVNALCACNLDGSELREIGHFPEAKYAPNVNTANVMSTAFIPAHSPLYNLQWLPTGKGLSFCHDETLYSVAAD